MPLLFTAFFNWTLNLAVTAPATIISSYIATKMSLSTEDGNMSCFRDPEVFTSALTIGWFVNLTVPLTIAYWIRLITLERFIDHHKSINQQEKLQSLFDN